MAKILINLKNAFEDLNDMVTYEGCVPHEISYLDCRAKNVMVFNGEKYCTFEHPYRYTKEGVRVYAVKSGDRIIEVGHDGDAYAPLYRLIVREGETFRKQIPAFFDVIAVQELTENEAVDAANDLFLEDNEFTMLVD